MDLAKKQRTKPSREPADNGTKQLNKTNGYTLYSTYVFMYAPSPSTPMPRASKVEKKGWKKKSRNKRYNFTAVPTQGTVLNFL